MGKEVKRRNTWKKLYRGIVGRNIVFNNKHVWEPRFGIHGPARPKWYNTSVKQRLRCVERQEPSEWGYWRPIPQALPASPKGGQRSCDASGVAGMCADNRLPSSDTSDRLLTISQKRTWQLLLAVDGIERANGQTTNAFLSFEWSSIRVKSGVVVHMPQSLGWKQW